MCLGTSCVLNGASELAERETRPWTSAYCLGHCDKSPVLLEPTGDVLACADAKTRARSPAPPPDIRCESPVAIVTRRIARGDFSGIQAARSDGAYEALRKALGTPPSRVVETIEASGARGRGGAAFPTGLKWRRCAEIESDEKYVIANGDEGDPGSFVDRVLLERDPHGVLEGLSIGAYAVGARRAFVFIRSEYPEAQRRMRRAIEEATAAGVLGASVMGSAFSLEVEVLSGLGSYVCGEETAMLNAVEGLRGEVRIRPPYPTESGLFGQPTLVDNVETLVNVPWIIEHGAEAYAALGTPASSGTKAICLNRGFSRPGVLEIEFGRSIKEVILDDAGGGRDGEPLEAALLGGPMGSVLSPDEWDVPVCYDAMASRGVRMGHGGLVAVPESADIRALLMHWLRFMREESCGKCAPCALGSKRALELAETSPADVGAIDDLLVTVSKTSLCAFGRETPKPIQQVLTRWGDRVFSPPDAAP